MLLEEQGVVVLLLAQMLMVKKTCLMWIRQISLAICPDFRFLLLTVLLSQPTCLSQVQALAHSHPQSHSHFQAMANSRYQHTMFHRQTQTNTMPLMNNMRNRTELVL